MIGSMLGIYKERIDPSLAGTPDLGTTENGGDKLIGTLVNVGTSPLGYNLYGGADACRNTTGKESYIRT
jgi:hypothetical protein